MTAKNNSTKSNFGTKGWLMIFVAGLLFYFYSGMCTDGLNTIVTNFANAHNCDEAAILATTTPASWAGLIGSVFWAWYVTKRSNREAALVTGVIGGISYMLYGVVSTIGGFAAVTAFVNFMGMGWCWTVADVLMANWFPTKKGLALGWATMGQNLASATFIILLTAFMGWTSMNGSFFIMGGLLVITGIVAFVLIRDTPEELGCTPDNGNLSKEQLSANLEELKNYKSPWTAKKMLCNREIWLISLGFGILIMVTVSLISRLIPRLIMSGWEPSKAIAAMSVAAILGLVGSYLTGWLDQKIGTRKASMVYGAWYFLALLFCALPATPVTLYLSIFFTGIGIGGIGNLMPSMTATVFGRFDFVRAMAVVNPVTSIVRSFAFLILAFSLERTGSYHLSYGILCVIDIVAIVLIGLIHDECVGKK